MSSNNTAFKVYSQGSFCCSILPSPVQLFSFWLSPSRGVQLNPFFNSLSAAVAGRLRILVFFFGSNCCKHRTAAVRSPLTLLLQRIARKRGFGKPWNSSFSFLTLSSNSIALSPNLPVRKWVDCYPWVANSSDI